MNKTPNAGQDELIDANEVARRLQMKANTILLMARQGRIPAVRVSRRIVRFDWLAVRQALS